MAEFELDAATVAAIRKVMHQVLDERSRIDGETHAMHHAVVAEWVKCRQRRSELLMGAATRILGVTGALGLAWFGAQILRGVVEAIQRIAGGSQ